jgi:ATP-dependent helicase/nuclease subunit A
VTVQLTDAEARQAIRTDLGSTMLVEAAAGTGKTSSLVARMINLVATGACPVENLAAITFTVKAAAELRERFQEALEKAVPEASPDRAFIGTTHAFCARLLRERPVEAGLDPEFEELDEVRAGMITEEFWQRYLERLVATGDERLARLRESGLRLRDLRSGFRRLIDHPDVEIVYRETERPDLQPIAREVSRMLDDIEPDLPDATDGHKQDDFEVMVHKLLSMRATRDLTEPLNVFDFLDEANHRSRRPTQKNWPDKKRAKGYGEDWQSFVNSTLRPALIRWREHTHGLAFSILEPAVREFETERRRAGTLTFQDLLVCARDLLRDHRHVRLYFQRRFRNLLVDEFQDTDPVQAEVMFYLTGQDVNEKDWRKLHPRPGSLFIVGDPKQSIYRFRRADITTYSQVRDQIARAGGQVVPLTSNFRSGKNICDWVNEFVGRKFAGADVAEGRQAEYVALSPTRPIGPNSGVYLLETPGRDSFDETACAEAENVAAWIRTAVETGMKIEEDGAERPVAWADFLLVTRNRRRLALYAAELERSGVPYTVTGSRAFAESEELYALLPLLHALVDPDDQVSLVAFLRGPLCGVDDQALYQFVRAGGRFSYLREQDVLDDRIGEALAMMKAVWTDVRRRPPAAALSRLADRLGVLAQAAARERGGTRSGNLLKALSIAREASTAGKSLAEVVDVLEQMLEERAEVEEMDVDPARDDAVRLMNLHQVKGLEAPIVFLVDPCSSSRSTVDHHVDRTGDHSRGYFTLSKSFGKSTKMIAQPPGWDSFENTEKSFHRAEEDRLLYVATTRAKNLLVIGHQGGPKPKGPWQSLVDRSLQALFRLRALRARQMPLLPPVEAPPDIAASFAAAGEESYAVNLVTKITHTDHRQLVKVEEGLGKGMSWGRVMHRLFEALLRDESLDVELHARNLLKDEEREPAEIDEVLRAVAALKGSQLYRRVLQSAQRMVEVPFATMTEGVLLHGVIDLVFLEEGIWHIIDYKTDSTAGRLQSLVDYYAPQVNAYVRFWQEITGQPSRGGLFFVDGAVERWLPGSS